MPDKPDPAGPRERPRRPRPIRGPLRTPAPRAPTDPVAAPSPVVTGGGRPDTGSAAIVGAAARRPARLVGVDAARGAALIGMAATHVLPEFGPAGQLTWAFRIAAGRSAAAFAVLAGVGLTLATARAARPRATTLVRAVCIGLVGLVLGETGTPLAVILPYYAVFFVFALPLPRARPGVLVAVAAAALLAEPLLSQLIRPHLPEPIMSNPSFGTLAATPGRLALTILLTGYYPALAWIGYLAVGMLVGRLDLRSARVAGWLLGGGAAVAVAVQALSWLLLGPLGGRSAILAADTVLPGVGPVPPGEVSRLLAAGLYGSTPTQTWWWQAVASPHATAPLDLLHTTGTAVALLGLALLAARLGADGRAGRVLLWPPAALGSMTLTWYTLHACLMSTSLLPGDPYVSYVTQLAVGLVAASAWRLTGRRGPLEAAIAATARLAGPASTNRAAT